VQTILPLKRQQAQVAAAVLARAFDDSPVFLAVLAHMGEARRRAALARVKWGFVQAIVRHHDASAIWVGDELAGVRLVVAPGGYPPSLSQEVWLSLGCATTGPTAILRFLRLGAYVTRRHLAGPHYYLFEIGIDPSLQGRGLGTALLSDLHAKADRERMPCYLETDKTRLVRLYESHGYEVVTDEEVPGLGGLRFWTMVRPPKS
jgi:ribosomal protein S18 acetylase RimI-like enzyme